MTAINGVFRNGRIELAVSPDWPEGCKVAVEPIIDNGEKEMRDED